MCLHEFLQFFVVFYQLEILSLDLQQLFSDNLRLVGIQGLNIGVSLEFELRLDAQLQLVQVLLLLVYVSRSRCHAQDHGGLGIPT
jgi:hypothetical protein